MNQPAPDTRLRAARASIIRRAEGTLSVDELARHLGVTEERAREDIEGGSILAVRLDPEGELRVPRVQLEGEGLMTGLRDVLAAMHVRDPWMRLQLLLDEDVIGPLRAGRLNDAIRAVDSYLPRDEGQSGR